MENRRGSVKGEGSAMFNYLPTLQKRGCENIVEAEVLLDGGLQILGSKRRRTTVEHRKGDQTTR